MPSPAGGALEHLVTATLDEAARGTSSGEPALSVILATPDAREAGKGVKVKGRP